MFTLTIKTDNAAFQAENPRDDSDDTAARDAEVVRILRDTARRIENGVDGGNVRDINGNTVGEFKFT